MKVEKKPGGVGLLIGVGPKPEGDYEPDELVDDEGESNELKLAAAEALMSAFKSSDPTALMDALDAYMRC